MSGATYTTQGFTRHELWSAGLVEECPTTRRACRYMPCTAAQEISCCKECSYPCANPCRIARGNQ